MLYLNRTGQSEGPYSEQQLVEMIRRGQLRAGWVAVVGQGNWLSLDSVPALARALATCQVSPRSEADGQPSAQHGSPSAQHDSPPAQHPAASLGQHSAASAAQSGLPPEAHGQHVAASAHGAAAVPAAHAYAAAPNLGTTPGYALPALVQAAAGQPTRGGFQLPLILGLAFLAFLVVGGAGAFALYAYFFQASGPRIAAVLPNDTQAYLEVPNLRAVAMAVRRARYLKPPADDEEVWLHDQAQAVSRAFGIDESSAVALVLAQHSLGVGIAQLGPDPHAAVLVQFDAARPVEVLLESPRFQAQGELGASGKRYALAPGTAPRPESKHWAAALQQALNAASTDEDIAIGWFRSGKLLAVGTPQMLTRIAAVQDGAPALSELPRFQRAMKSSESDALLLGWLDGKAVQELVAAQSEVEVALADQGAVLGVDANEVGVILQLVATLVGRDVADTSLFFEPASLGYPVRLPAETMAYAAISTKTSLDGRALEEKLRSLIERKQPGADREIERALGRFEQATGVSFAEALGAVGSEIVVGVMAPEDLKLGDADQLQAGAAFAAMKLENSSVAEKLVAQLRDTLLARELEAGLTVEGKGMSIEIPRLPRVVVEVQFVGDQLVVAGGASDMTQRALAAFGGQGPTLAGDEAHAAVLETLPAQASQIIWVDSGRLADRLLAGDPGLQELAKEVGLPLQDVKLTGPQRITSVLAFSVASQSTAWRLQLNATNVLQGAALLASLGAASMSRPGGDLGRLLAGDGVAGGGLPGLVGIDTPEANGTCAQAMRCCEQVLRRTKAGDSGGCDALGTAPASLCSQALNGYRQALQTSGSSCP